MEYNTSELCDIYTNTVDVVEPIFISFGGRSSCGGVVSTVKCFEDNKLISDVLTTDGTGKILVIDGGGSTRRALLDNNTVQQALEQNWEGIVVYGALRDVDALEEADIGIYALASIPVGSDDLGHGEAEVPVNFGGVTFLPEDHLYADSTGIILSPDPLDIE